MTQDLCSIIIRTKNEERWISNCLKEVFLQKYKNFEVIILDNYSTDKTLEKASLFPIKKILKIKKYLPGFVLNKGVKIANGKYVIFLSSHCIPTNSFWLSNLVKAIKENKNFAGVYGRQEPMSFTSPADKRDLHLLFGLDRRIHIKDSFFHNANSIIPKKLLIDLPFDNKVTNIEDRLWAQKQLSKGYQILYEPEASVYHHHGVHQTGNESRLNNTVKIIENNLDKYSVGKINPNKLNIYAIIPVKGKSLRVKKTNLVSYTINKAKKSKYINEIIVSTDNKETVSEVKKIGAKCPFIRPKNLSLPFVNLEKVIQYSLSKIEEKKKFPDLIVHLEETFPFRSDTLIDQMILRLLDEGFDTIIASKEESGWLWKQESDESFHRIDKGDIPRNFKDKSFLGLKGLCMITYPEIIRNKNGLGNKIGLFKIKDQLSSLEIKTKNDIKMIENFL